MSKFSDTVREMFRQGDEQRDKDLTIPEDVFVIRDIIYGEQKKIHKLDIYRPKGMRKMLPVIVSIHGGGWIYGTKETYQYYCMSLAQHGFAVVNFNYRLAPEYKYPAPLEDTNSVFRWIMEHANEYQLDINHIFGVGDSAGAQILGSYAAICSNPEYAKLYSFETPIGFIPKAIALNCGIYHMEYEGEETDFIHMLAAEYLTDRGTMQEYEKICIDNYLTSNFPPTFLMTATGDFLDYQSKYLVEELLNHKIPFVFRFYGDSNTELGHVFHCNIKLYESKMCNLEECNFFKQYMS